MSFWSKSAKYQPETFANQNMSPSEDIILFRVPLTDIVKMGLGVPESVLVEYQVRKYNGSVIIHVYLSREWLIHD